jgi:hypothetical protein
MIGTLLLHLFLAELFFQSTASPAAKKNLLDHDGDKTGKEEKE